MRMFAFCVLVTLCSCLPALAGDPALQSDFLTTRPVRDPWRIDWTRLDVTTPSIRPLVLSEALAQQPLNQQSQQPVHAAAVQHSDAYETRAKIHKYASYATLPLFAGELALGQSLFNSSSQSGKGLHSAVGAGIIGLFGVNTVTGAWNMFGEGWQDQDGRTFRLVHGLLMMAADAGFVATWATAPGGRDRASSNFDQNKRTHRAIAVASIGVGTGGYLMMLLANHSPFARAQNSPTPGASASSSADNGTTAQPVESTETQAAPSAQTSPAETASGQPVRTSGLTPPAEPADTSSQPADTSSPQIGGTSPPGTTSPVPSTTFPIPQHTGLSTLFRDTVLDYATFPRRESTWVILGIGGALAASLHPLDDDVNSHLASSGAADKIWKPGHIIGGPVMYIAPPAVYLYGRYILPMFNDDTATTNKWSHMGLDLVRAELLEEGLVQAIKVSVNRTRPNGQKYSFPSGHAAATFAFASVIERHLGARLALPTILIATYVGTSRLHDNVHFLSDVVFGAALGTAAGWTVVGRHGRTNYSLMPTPVPGGMAFMVTRTPRSGN